MGDAARKLLLTTEDAAELLSLSVPTFRRHVVPCVDCVRVGSLARWRPEDLAAWRDGPKGGRSEGTSVRASGSSVSEPMASVSPDPQVRQIAARLKSRLRASSPKSPR